MECIFDTGVAAHLSPERSGFKTYHQVREGQISVANDDLCNIAGVGSMELAVSDEKFELHNVRHVPDLGYNLISKGYLEYQGFDTDLIKDGSFRSYYTITSPNGVVFEAPRPRFYLSITKA